MSSQHHNLSSPPADVLPDASTMRLGILVSEWNQEITGNLLAGCLEILAKQGLNEKDILIRWVPGSFELPTAASILLDSTPLDGVICLGCVIQGETRHFEFICQAVAQGITRVSLDAKKPVIFGVLTTDTLRQAIDRSGGKYGNKGHEAAVAAIRMIALQQGMK